MKTVKSLAGTEYWFGSLVKVFTSGHLRKDWRVTFKDRNMVINFGGNFIVIVMWPY